MPVIIKTILIASLMTTLSGCQYSIHRYWYYEHEVFERNPGRVFVNIRARKFHLGNGKIDFTEPYTLTVNLYVKDDNEKNINIRVLSLESLGKRLVANPLDFRMNTEDIRYRGSAFTLRHFLEIPRLFTAHEPIDVKYEISYMGLTETFESRLEPKFRESRKNTLINNLKSEFL